MRRDPTPVVVLFVALAAAGCTSGNDADRSPAPDAAPSAEALTESARLCATVPTPLAASSLTTVEAVREYDVGGPVVKSPGPSDRPLRAAFGAASGAEPAAWCTVGANGDYTFYAAGPDETAVKVLTVSGWTGPVPERPVPVP